MSGTTAGIAWSSTGFRRLLLPLLSSLLLAPVAAADTLSRQEADIVRAEVQYLTSSFERGDAEPLIQKSHPSLARMAGGPDVFAQAVRRGVAQLRTSGFSYGWQPFCLPVAAGRAPMGAWWNPPCAVPRSRSWRPR